MKKNNLIVFFIATEQSGDNLGSELMKQFNSNSYYNFEYYGIGGDLMINEGLNITNHLSEFKSIGFIEIIKNLKNIFSILNKNILNFSRQSISHNPFYDMLSARKKKAQKTYPEKFN